MELVRFYLLLQNYVIKVQEYSYYNNRKFIFILRLRRLLVACFVI